MTLIIRQVTKSNNVLKFIANVGLMLFLTGIILTSCNTYIKQDGNSGLMSEKPNDTAMLAEAIGIAKHGLQAAEMARLKSSDQSIRIFAEKISLFLQKSEQTWDSLSEIKKISFEPIPGQNNEIADLEHLDIEEFDNEFLDFMENQLNKQMEMLENVSTLSEDNEISTLAIKMIPDLQNQLDTLSTIREANFLNF